MAEFPRAFDAEIAKLERADQLGKKGTGRFRRLISEIAKETKIAPEDIYVVGMSRPNNFNIRLTQGRAQRRHHRLSLGIIYRNVKAGTVESGMNAASPYLGTGNAQHDAVGVVTKTKGTWKIDGLVERPGAGISEKLIRHFPEMNVREVSGVPAASAPPPARSRRGRWRDMAQWSLVVESDVGEIAAQFSQALRDAYVSFGDGHDDIVRRFVASLMAKPFVILTGLSGSGKSQIAIQLGHWFGEERSLLVPVRPDWTGPEALLGYENALAKPNEAGGRAWVVPRVLEFVLGAARDQSGLPYLLILDEMNLAHVERYFADFLSGMESGAPVLPDLLKEEAGWYPNPETPFQALPRNLFVVGTVNVDETTYLFSPKVLDRANTIEFRVPTSALAKDAASVRKPDDAPAAGENVLRGFVTVASDDAWHLENAPGDADDFVAHVRALHEGLSATGFEFGHRTFYEGVRLSALLSAAGMEALEDRLDVFVLQKVLPRLHGARRKLDRVLRSVAGFAADLRPPKDALELDLEKPVPAPSLPRTYAKVQRMHEALRTNQFASFAE